MTNNETRIPLISGDEQDALNHGGRSAYAPKRGRSPEKRSYRKRFRKHAASEIEAQLTE